jgi:hypothetical protein
MLCGSEFHPQCAHIVPDLFYRVKRDFGANVEMTNPNQWVVTGMSHLRVMQADCVNRSFTATVEIP